MNAGGTNLGNEGEINGSKRFNAIYKKQLTLRISQRLTTRRFTVPCSARPQASPRQTINSPVRGSATLLSALQRAYFSNQGFLLRVDAPINLCGRSGRLGLTVTIWLVAEYVIGGGATSDTHVLKVIKGTQTAGAATDPTLEQDSLITGTAGGKRQEPLLTLRPGLH